MLDWTDTHCRFFHRLITRHTRLYTEMVTTGALLHGDVARHLRFDPSEHPVALQLGGSEPEDLAQCARLAERWGYDEVNLNCGCPSERVQRGAFGACLMRESTLVAQCVRAMRDAVALPVTVKHRIGLDHDQDYAPLRDFVGTVAQAGCCVFIVHARNAWLKGLSPKENREVPPLRYDVVYRLKRDFPQLTIVLNGGVVSDDQIAQHLAHVDGVMVGRQAYHQPWCMSTWDTRFWNDTAAQPTTRESVEQRMVRYMQAQQAAGVSWPAVAKAMLGLRHGLAGGRAWRRVWSDAHRKGMDPQQIMVQAHAAAALAQRTQGASTVTAPV
ncbi:MAG: tRNA dihydrouridine(20/20a) synthase DusA [Rhodoferax sp.]